MLGTMIQMLMITYIVLMITFYFMHQTTKQHIQDIHYQVVEAISTQGIFGEGMYDYLQHQLDRYGEYIIKMRLEKYIKPGMYDTYYEMDDIVGRSLTRGDRITVYIEDRKATLFGRMLNATLLGYKPPKAQDIRIRSMKAATIERNTRYLGKGYDVIIDIKQKLADDTVAVLVYTKANQTGKYYGLSGHPDIEVDNLLYGDSPDEALVTGENYIFPEGDFIKEVQRYGLGHALAGQTRTVIYRQQ